MSDWFFALWRKGDGTQWWHAGQSLSDFKTTDDGYFKEGLRLVATDTDDDAYFDQGSGSPDFVSATRLTPP